MFAICRPRNRYTYLDSRNGYVIDKQGEIETFNTEYDAVMFIAEKTGIDNDVEFDESGIIIEEIN